VASFDSIPPLSKPKVEAPQNEGRANLTRIAVIVGALAIAGAAGFLLFSPQKPMPDELKDLESETTMPVESRTNVASPVGPVPSPSQSASMAGTAGENPSATNNPAVATPRASTNTDPTATKYDEVSFAEALSKELRVMDLTAFTLCKENDLPILVFDISTPGNLRRALAGESIGTLIK
jgi:hypothetical protein